MIPSSPQLNSQTSIQASYPLKYASGSYQQTIAAQDKDKDQEFSR